MQTRRNDDQQNWLAEAVKAIQMYSAGLLSKRTTIARLGLVPDVDEELARIDRENATEAL